jgi:hypothetical protein
MGYYLKTIIGAALFLACVALFNIALLELLKTGTCASGGPYVVAQPCPDGTGKWAGAITGSIPGGLIAAAIFAFRGDRPGGSGESLANGFFGWGTFAWGLFFAASGTVALIGSLTGDLPEDGKLGGLIVAGTFLFMGLPVFLFSLKGILGNLFSGRRGGKGGQPMSMGEQANAAAAAAAGSGAPAGEWTQAATVAPVAQAAQAAQAAETRDQLAELEQLERLDRLRKSGALSQAEFDREKAKILGG